ncbi:Precorrin-2 C(20)-methyltransferase [Dissostichus eleginoides]|uniref:Precorrin-2 C(20)-methyltransferase n=1 Tax=Dissostichus eleginoides TaxID=100907 RepID=A0AAD9BXH3_DISEL|nr:Precorrin-2 C(20)-methyltransferase [Dissostichus eleginoides]
MVRADLQQKIQTREQKISEVTSSVKDCMGGLDAECLEINSVSSEVMRVVEDSRKKALQPLEERKQRVSREGKDQVKKLQKEIDKIRKTIDELEESSDLQGLPKTGLDEYQDWKNVTVDTSFSFGSLRTTISSMMEQIHQELEKLSSVEEPLKDIFGPYLEIDHQQFTWRNAALEESRHNDSGPNNGVTPVWEFLQLNRTLSRRPQTLTKLIKGAISPLVHSLHCSPCHRCLVPQAFLQQQKSQPSLYPLSQMFGTPTTPAAAGITVNDTNTSFVTTQQNFQQTATNSDITRQVFTFPSGAQPSVLPMPQMFGTPTIPAAEVPVMKTQQNSLQNATNSDKTHQAFDLSSGAQPSLMPMSQIFGSPTIPTVKDVTVTNTNKSMFETPPHLSTTHQNTNNVRRALDFSTGAQQVGQLNWEHPTTTAQETMRQDMIRAYLHQKIQTREQKISEVTSSVKACKGGLDAEWLEINSVFSEVMRVVEDSRKKALQPLEERRQRVSREGLDQVKKLQKEIDKIRKTIDELDKNADLQGLPKTGLDESRDWKHLTVDTSFSFGSLRTTISSMMEQIHQELEKLSSVELKRIPTFAGV